MEQVKKRFNIALSIKIFVCALLALFIVVPLFFIFAGMGSINAGSVIASPKFLTSLLNSLTSTLTSTAISMLLAFILAYVCQRSKIRFKGVFAVVLTIPMLIPSVAHGMGLIVLFGNNGIFTRLFHASAGLYGFWGVVLGSVMYAFPPAFLMFNDIFKYEDRSVYEAADMLTVPKWRQFKDLTLPYAAKPALSIFFATFILILTDYGVPLMVGGRFETLPLFMYNEVIGQQNFGVGAIVAVVLLIPAVSATIFDIFKKDTDNLSFSAREVGIKKNKKRDIISYILCFGTLIVLLLPIVTFSVIGFMTKYPTDLTLGFANLLRAFQMKAGEYLLNSLFIALTVGTVGTAFAYLIAYLTARTKGRKSGIVLHLLTLVSLAVPGMVLGISYSLMYGKSLFMGTLTMIILVNSIHFLGSPYIMCYNALNKVNKNYETVAKTMAIPKGRFIFDILLPETFDTVIEMFSYFFVNSMVTISAVSFIASSVNMPLSLLINRFESQMFIECSAIVAFIILLVNGLMKLAVYLIKRRRIIASYK